MQGAIDDLLRPVGARLPERFYLPGEPIWKASLTALLARMASMLRSIGALAHPERQHNAVILVRSLYEYLVLFLWLAIDPAPRVREWSGQTMRHRKTVHHAALAYGVERILDEEELERAGEAEKLDVLEQRAHEVDAYWGPRIHGLYTNPLAGPKQIRTLGGL